MNKSALKKYAPQARLDFIAAVTRRAELLGLNPESPAKVEQQGDALLINGQAFPAAYGRMRTMLEARIREQGFDQVMEAMAYTWFNRLVAIRYMELHGFLDHGCRVLSHPANEDTGHTQPEILDHIPELDLPDFDKEQALELKLAGNRDEELYREVLLAQCHALHKAMPFLFESLDDATELLLPDGLLRTDSILGKLVTAIDEADWQDVEIIGWLYQFYISEKKDQVIGKVVKSEDIPAATQLFTPNWIVKYLVQNSLGRLWLMANPTSTLATKWEYYIQPAEQTPEVNAQLDGLIQARIDEDGASLNPESLTLLDPACGSGHILVEAYDLLRNIYLERGYRRQDIPRLILEKNLYGLDIDDRAAQLAGFALLMKARADDRRLFGQPVALNVLALQEAKAGSASELHSALNAPQISSATVSQLVEAFEQAKTFGSLIQIPGELASTLSDLWQKLEAVRRGGDMLGQGAAEALLRLVAQAEVLAKQFDAVVANPPYMGSGVMSPQVKKLAKKHFPAAKSDLYTCFIQRGCELINKVGYCAMVTMDGWMFLSTYSEFRDSLLSRQSVDSLAHIGWNCFPEVHTYHRGAAVVLKCGARNQIGDFLNLSDVPATVDKGELFLSLLSSGEKIYRRTSADFRRIPTSPLAYWASPAVSAAFASLPRADSLVIPREGLATGNNEKYVRFWYEVSHSSIGINISSRKEAKESRLRWFPYNKGGDFRKWSGNNLFVVDWLNDGYELQNTQHPSGARIWAHNFNLEYIFRPFVAWSDVTSKGLTLRVFPSGYLFDATGLSAFSRDPEEDDSLVLMAALGNSALGSMFSRILNPTLHFKSGNFAGLPIDCSVDVSRANRCIDLAKSDWNAYERSWDFQFFPMLMACDASGVLLETCYSTWIEQIRLVTTEMKHLEEDNNQVLIEAYGMSEELAPDVPIEEVTLTVNPAYRYGANISESERWARFRRDTHAELVSYTIGCMMGRYSLDAHGLIYAHAGNEGFDSSRYETFPADEDGIVPITDEAWFDDDGANRIREFVRVVWGEDNEAENMTWVAESLGSKASESADDTIRRYLSRDFYKDHLQTYKKRPIYWLFSSGKHKAFEALVYLHRYNAGTLSRMRMEYVVPLQSRMQARIDNLEQDIQSSTSSAEQKRFQKKKDRLIKQLDELRRFDENLRHYADQRITLDLDDGVKVNYGKFGDLLAEMKAVTGRAPSKND